MQGCFQSMDDNPAFDYPEPYVPEARELKFHLPFEGTLNDVDDNYRPIVTLIGDEEYGDGIKGKAFQGAESRCMKVDMIALPESEFINLGSFTAAFWMKSGPNVGNTSLFTIANRVWSQGNVDIWLENFNGVKGQARFKGYMRNYSETDGERTTWIDVPGQTPEGSTLIDDVFDKWTHIAFRYNGETSEFSIFKDGEPALLNRSLGDFGPLKFNKETVTSVVLGGFGFQAEASDVSLSWAGTTYQGKFDEYRFYTAPLSDAQIKELYSKKE